MFSSRVGSAPDQISYSQPCRSIRCPGQASACATLGSCRREAGLTLTTRTVPERITKRKSGTWLRTLPSILATMRKGWAKMPHTDGSKSASSRRANFRWLS